ncbi:hypothetical protein DPMN_130353 [Dreissena polymorpha]|uniref:Uncharacterized protein n=1 Tax=Dreissena polymorpha TaxID=45954 RepID=A0A9D4JXI0_DREPO|nr:hypothetical protein DPMN_130353 [Dreissena polymorpha]
MPSSPPIGVRGHKPRQTVSMGPERDSPSITTRELSSPTRPARHPLSESRLQPPFSRAPRESAHS